MSNALPFPSRNGEIVRCPTHQWAWHTRAAGCDICKSHRIAQQLIDNEPAATTGVSAEIALRVCAQLERDLFAAMTGGAR